MTEEWVSRLKQSSTTVQFVPFDVEAMVDLEGGAAGTGVQAGEDPEVVVLSFLGLGSRVVVEPLADSVDADADG